MKDALVSVIVPVYNVEKYLDKCISSIVKQTYNNLEIILVDDGSPDKCPSMCDKWAQNDNRVTVIHKENGGLSDARNCGLSIAKGEYIAFVDSDDWIEPNFIEVLLKELDNGADIAECGLRLCDDNNNTIRVKSNDENESLNVTEAFNRLVNEQGISVTACNKIYKRSVIRNIEFPVGKYHEDVFWTWKIFLNAEKVSVINAPLYNYLQRQSSIMGEGYSTKRLDALEACFERYQTLKDDSNYSAFLKNDMIANCLFNLQSAMKYLKGDEYLRAKAIILSYYNQLLFHKNDKDISGFWLKMFLRFPRLTAKIRSITGIGF